MTGAQTPAWRISEGPDLFELEFTGGCIRIHLCDGSEAEDVIWELKPRPGLLVYLVRTKSQMKRLRRMALEEVGVLGADFGPPAASRGSNPSAT